MVTTEDLKVKRLAVLAAQKALMIAQADFQQAQIQKQIDDLNGAANG